MKNKGFVRKRGLPPADGALVVASVMRGRGVFAALEPFSEGGTLHFSQRALGVPARSRQKDQAWCAKQTMNARRAPGLLYT